MARISQEEIDRVRSQADIVDVIGHYLQITRKGRSFTAVCPFHDDHSPSLSISPDRQIYKCFVCGNGGNVFTFVQNYEKVSFPEAVGRVASLIGYSLSVQPDSYQRPKDPHKEALIPNVSFTKASNAMALCTTAQTPAKTNSNRNANNANALFLPSCRLPICAAGLRGLMEVRDERLA